MPLSDAEKARRYRERQKAKKQAALKMPTPPSEIFKKPFFEFYPIDVQVSSQYCQSLELAGFEAVTFLDDTGPEASTLDDLSDPNEPSGSSNPFGSSAGNSLGKAEVIIGCLLDAASDLAAEVNAYKRSEIATRIGEIEASDLTDPDARRAAFDQVVALKNMLADLEKEIRWPLNIWKVDAPS